MSPRVASRRWWLALRQAPRPPCGRSGGCSPRCWCRPTAARRRPKSTVDAHGSETLPPQRLRLRALSDFPPLSYSPLLLGWKMRGASPSLWLSGGVPRTPPNRRKQSPTLVETDLPPNCERTGQRRHGLLSAGSQRSIRLCFCPAAQPIARLRYRVEARVEPAPPALRSPPRPTPGLGHERFSEKRASGSRSR